MGLARYEAGALRFFRGEPIPPGGDLDGNTERHGWLEARRFLDGSGMRSIVAERERLTALWLEHRASELEARAVDLAAIGKGVEAERAVDDARALEVAARYIRRELLGEEEDDG